ncbi:hypothetical protein DLM22_00670 [Salmonella enterica subsp. enterica serovar Stanleyville]|nr:hypothetical protein [Salmonella enterica subsp. enterica serovar Stanleyville]
MLIALHVITLLFAIIGVVAYCSHLPNWFKVSPCAVVVLAIVTCAALTLSYVDLILTPLFIE